MALQWCRWRGFSRPVILSIAVIVAVLFLLTTSPLSHSTDKVVLVELQGSESSKVLLDQKSLEEVTRIPTTAATPPFSFDGFNNQTGSDHLIVPNIIHFVRFNKTQYTFPEFLCLQAAYRHHRPDYFYIHTDVGDLFTGKYWNWIQRDPDLKSRIRMIHLPLPSEVFGQPLSSGWRFQHGSDVSRIQLLIKYGGIYLDNDVFVIQNLDKYRRFEIAMNWDVNQFIGNQVFVAHKDARFLKIYLESYRNNYHSDRWYYNGGERPTTEILYHHPELLHRVKGGFGADTGISMKLYHDVNFDWRVLDTIHLLINHRSYMDPHYNITPVFDENNIKTYPYPFGEMAREIIEELENEPFWDT